MVSPRCVLRTFCRDYLSRYAYCFMRRRRVTQSAKPVLSRKHASLQFLYSLAGSPRPRNTPVSLPSLAPPPVSQHSSAPSTPAELHSASPLPKGKSKADVLREYRNKIGEQSSDPYICATLMLLWLRPTSSPRAFDFEGYPVSAAGYIRKICQLLPGS